MKKKFDATEKKITLEVNVNGGAAPGHKVNDRRRVNERGWLLGRGREGLCAGQDVRMPGPASPTSPAETPEEMQEKLALARSYHGSSLFIQQGLQVKVGFYNYGLRFVLAPARANAKGDRKAEAAALKDWVEQNTPALRRLVREVWEDRLCMDNAVIFWREKGAVRGPTRQVFTLPPERCQYADPLGIEILKVQLGWKEQDFADRDSPAAKALNKDLIKRYARNGYITLDPREGEMFRVLKRDRVGWGFSEPRLMALYRTLQQEESLQVADNLWAFMSRSVIRQFKVGHEIRNGPRAGQNLWFWKRERGNAIKAFFEGRTGLMDFSGNFDIDIVYPHPDQKWFDRAKFDSVYERMSIWLGPAGAVMWPQGNNPWTMDALRSAAEAERSEVGPFLSDVINSAMQPPHPVRVVWSDRIFQEGRARLELTKFLLAQGPLSGRTALQTAGFDAEEEREYKAEEGALVQSEGGKHQVLPAYDSAHGNQPAVGEPGRPAGKAEN
jgi:hypothetical protein